MIKSVGSRNAAGFFMCILTKEPVNDNTIIGNQIISNPMEGFTCRYVIQALTQDL